MQSLAAERQSYAELRHAWRPARQPLIPAMRHNPDPGIMDGLMPEGRLVVVDRIERLRGRQADDVAGAVVAGHPAAEFDLGGDGVQQRAARR